MLSATSLRRALALVLLAVPPLVSTPEASGLGEGAGVAQSPPLESGISLVSLDFLAIGRDGQPVPDLKAEEVSLKLGGRARPLTAINLVDVVGPTGSAQPSAVSPLPPPFGTNVQSREARAFVLAVDDDSFRVGTERALREAADTFLDKLAPTDRIALVTMPYGGTRVSLTTEQEAVRASLASIVGQAPTNESPDDMACRSRRTVDSLRGLFEGFIGSPIPVTVAFFCLGLIDGNGKLVAQAPFEAADLKPGQPVMAALLVPPGSYRLRAAATDAGGRTGTSDYELTAELRQAGPLELSGLVLGLSRGGFVSRMQFGREPVAIAYIELYGGSPGQQVSVVFELARTLNGPPLVSMPGTLAVAGDHYSATAPIPIGTLSPGDYIVRAMVGVAGGPSTRVERTLRKIDE